MSSLTNIYDGKKITYIPSSISFWLNYTEALAPFVICAIVYLLGLVKAHIVVSIILLFLSVLFTLTSKLALPSPLLTLLISFFIAIYSFPRDMYIKGNLVETLVMFFNLLEIYYAQSLLSGSLLAAAISLIFIEVYRRKTKYVIDEEGVKVRYPSLLPLLNNMKSVNYPSIIGVKVSQGIVGRMFNYGTIDLVTDSKTEIKIFGVRDPRRIGREIEKRVKKSSLTREDIISQVLVNIETLERRQEKLLRKITNLLRIRSRRYKKRR